jgi:D-alanyl-D-alanine carboxypeptidase (penicillin-binding protein 5/6)
MRTETKRVLYIFLTLCIILTFALFLSWVADGTGSGDESFVVSDTTSAELSDNASHVIAEQSDVTGEQSDYSTEESLNSEESIDISEEVSDVSEQSDEHVISDNFPVSYIENNVTAGYIAVYNVTEGKYIYGKNENEKCYPASLTKLVTALLAVKHLDTNEIITVGDEIRRIGKGSSVAYLVVGYRMKLEVLLDAMMLPSGNDAAYTAAVAVGRKILGDKNASIDAALECFYKAANEYVRSIGCTGTNIACPDGYHDDNHYTTAWDYVLISKEAMKNPLIMKVVQKKVAYDTLADGTQVKYENTNLLLDYAYVTGLKTGTTNEAGYCVAVSAKSNGVEIIVVVMKSTSAAARYEGAKKLISAAYGWF